MFQQLTEFKFKIFRNVDSTLWILQKHYESIAQASATRKDHLFDLEVCLKDRDDFSDNSAECGNLIIKTSSLQNNKNSTTKIIFQYFYADDFPDDI